MRPASNHLALGVAAAGVMAVLGAAILAGGWGDGPKPLPPPTETATASGPSDLSDVEAGAATQSSRRPGPLEPAALAQDHGPPKREQLAGRVVDHVTGRAIADAAVTLLRATEGEEVVSTTRSGPLGRFLVLGDGTDERLHLLRVSAPSYADATRVVREGRVDDGTIQDLGDVGLARGVRLRGEVRGAEGGPIAAPARIFVFDAELGVANLTVEVATTTPDGNFELPGIAIDGYPDRHLLAVTDTGLGWERVGSLTSESL